MQYPVHQDQFQQQQDMSKLTQLLIQQQVRASLPEQKIDKFDGDPLKYTTFIKAFEYGVEDKTQNSRDRLAYLCQYTTGEANVIVKSCLHYENPEEGYYNAKDMLKRRFGDRRKIAQLALKKALDWTEIKEHDSEGLRKFSMFLMEAEHTMSSIRGLTELNHTSSLQVLMKKLPYRLRSSWRNKVYEIEEERGQIVNFHDFVQFVDKQTKIMINPAFGAIQTPKEDDSQKKKMNNKARKVRSFSTKTEQKKSTSNSKQSTDTKNCEYCKGTSHNLETCFKMGKLPIDEKLKFIRQQGMCFACLKKGKHISKDCKNKLVCKECAKGHPTVLHQDKLDNTKEEKATTDKKIVNKMTSRPCSHTGAGEDDAYPTIIPVTVYSRNTGISVETYAHIDQGSDAVFCTKSLQNQLGASGPETKLEIETITETTLVKCQVLQLEVSDLDRSHVIKLPKVYTQESIPADASDVIVQEDISQFSYLEKVNLPKITHDANIHVGLLIGNNVPTATEPLEVINSRNGGPYAVKTILGWCVHGVHKKSKSRKGVYRVRVNTIEEQIKQLYNHEFPERLIDDKPQLSVQDQEFMSKVNTTTKLVDGHYEIGLPIRNPDKEFINNLSQVEQRAAHLKRRFEKDSNYHEKYTQCINEMLQKNYAEEVPEDELSAEPVWYIPHHGVVHQQKGKLRVVFDCGATYMGQSLNSRLLQGPDLTNNLTGVLLRFRQHPIAVIADIEAMYYQVRVPKTDRDLMRFLWWEEGNVNLPLKEYRMCAHVFGAKSSPACANFALKRAAQEAQDGSKYNDEACNRVKTDFYVDDCLTSVENSTQAIRLVEDLTNICKDKGFRLTKWLSNSKEVLQCVPQSERAKTAKSLDLDNDDLPSERVLGLLWSPESDTFGFQIVLKERPCSRRGILATVSAIYDPLGFLAPAILPAKRILQSLCKLQLDWDATIPPEYESSWNKWLQEVPYLSNFAIQRCFRPVELSKSSNIQLHHFSDASENGYGTVSYIRSESSSCKVHVSLLMAKARVAPLKKVTIPRLELTAATSMVKINSVLQRELQTPIDKVYYWTDSETVLKYICNTTARFQTFVANRVALIKDGSQTSQWRHIGTKANPADACSRGVSAETLVNNKSWTTGPEFLYQSEEDWPNTTANYVASDLSDDPEVKGKVKVNTVLTEESIEAVEKLLTYFSSWYKLCRSVAWIIRIKNQLFQRMKRKHNEDNMDNVESHKEVKGPCQTNTDASSPLTVTDIIGAEKAIIGYEQRKWFSEEWKLLSKHQQCQDQTQKENEVTVKKSSPLRKLNPFMLDNLLRVGGRLSKAALPEETKFPIILPRKSIITDLIMHNAHETTGHGGRNFMLANLYQKYWIIGANSLARRVIHRCVVCRKQRARVCEQQMADLPQDRVTAENPPFTCVGVDYFGPFLVKRGRSVVKRYGVMFTCLSTRAIHLEKADALDTDNCINAIRRFIARRGQVREIRSDNGTNLVGAERELREEIKRWNQAKFNNEMLQRNIDWKFNPPAGSHFGGVWERQIKTVRKIMSALVKQQLLTDDSLSTLFCEIEAIVNNRPITAVQGSAGDLEPLTPNTLLLMKNGENLPPAVIERPDQYAKKRWRQIQYLSDMFWRRWSREYLTQLQERQKWNTPHINLQVGDIVLVADSNRPRNSWQMGRVVDTFPDEKGLVRQARVQTRSGAFVRPVAKLCLLVEFDTSKQEADEVNDNRDSQTEQGQSSDEPKIRPKRISKKPQRLDL